MPNEASDKLAECVEFVTATMSLMRSRTSRYEAIKVLRNQLLVI